MIGAPSLTFLWWWLLLLLPLPWLYRALRSALPHRSPALTVPVYDQLLVGQPVVRAPRQRRLTTYALLIAIWTGSLLASARPVWVGEAVELPTTGRDLMLAVDISGSMIEADMPLGSGVTERILAVKVVLGQFIERRLGDRLGLILFGSEPYLQAPLTFDHRALGELLQEAQLGFAGNATAIGSAIGLGIKRLQNRPESHRVMILLTDGANTAGMDPQQAAQAAAQFGVKIYTVGIGSEPRGLRGMFRGNELDEQTLRAIADQTGGQYFRARNVNELNRIYQYLDQLEPVAQETETLRPTRSLYHWPLAVALLAGLALIWQRGRGPNSLG